MQSRRRAGFGPDGTSPDEKSWTWTTAQYNADKDGLGHLDNDEYVGAPLAVEAGTYDLAYRVSLDGGETWLLCDLDGSDNGYDPAEAGALTVSP